MGINASSLSLIHFGPCTRYSDLLNVWRIEAAPLAGRVSTAAAAATEFAKVNPADQGQVQNVFAKLNKAAESGKVAGGLDAFSVDMASESSWPAGHGVIITLPCPALPCPALPCPVLCCAVLTQALTCSTNVWAATLSPYS